MTAFDGWALPPELDAPEVVEGVPLETGGGELRFPGFGPEEAGRLSRAVRGGRRAALARRSVESLVSSLGRVGERFLDPDDPFRKRALELLPPSAGISETMAREVVDGMARDWTEDRLRTLLRAEFDGDPSVLDRFRPSVSGAARVRAVGPDLCFQVCAGTVPGVSVTSMIRALLVKAAVVLKPGRGDVVLPVLFGRALAEEDAELAGAVAVLYWPGGRKPVEDRFLDEADAVVVYGSDETVRSFRDRVSLRTTFVAYPHRLSAALVGRGALADAGTAAATADRAARAAALFDQRGCVSPHVGYVERGGEVDPSTWAEELARAFAELESVLPSGSLRPGEASGIQQLRGTAELRAAAGDPVRIHHGGDDPWTVLVEEEPGFRPSCLGRVIRIRPVDDLAAAVEELSALGGRLQTVALEGAAGQREELAEALARIGAVRITTLDRMPWPPAWWHHDGVGALRALVRWVDLEGG